MDSRHLGICKNYLMHQRAERLFFWFAVILAITKKGVKGVTPLLNGCCGAPITGIELPSLGTLAVLWYHVAVRNRLSEAKAKRKSVTKQRNDATALTGFSSAAT